jgi:1-acyl-sn-glycerol-3-phosphate acyltransferase
MKNIFNAALRLLVKIALHGYYHRILVEGKKNLPKKKAVIIIANHQNALVDPLLIATQTKLKPHFLTRASVFKKPFYAKLLDFIRMIPVYRVRDGVENMEKNKETFDRSAQILKEKGSVLIFVEGGHSHQRNLRPLRKGFARIAFQALEADSNLDLQILPIGINYSNHKSSGSKVRIIVGKAFSAKDHYPNFDSLMKAGKEALQPLIAHIPEGDHYEEHLQKLIDEKVDLTSPDFVAKALASKEKTAVKSMRKPYLANKIMKICHLPLYGLWLYAQPKIKDQVFVATFKFLIGFVFGPVWYLLLILVSANTDFFGTWLVSLLFLAWLSLLINRNPQE